MTEPKQYLLDSLNGRMHLLEKETTSWLPNLSPLSTSPTCALLRQLMNTYRMALSAVLYANSASWGRREVKRYLANVCIGTLSRWMTSPKPLYGPPAGKTNTMSGLYKLLNPNFWTSKSIQYTFSWKGYSKTEPAVQKVKLYCYFQWNASTSHIHNGLQLY